LDEDHANAAFLAQGMAALGYDCGRVQTNIVIFDLGERMPVPQLLERLKTRGVLAGGAGGTRVRFVTHNDVSRADCEIALAATRESLL
jgi:threonine aldolase